MEFSYKLPKHSPFSYWSSPTTFASLFLTETTPQTFTTNSLPLIALHPFAAQGSPETSKPGWFISAPSQNKD